MDGYRVILHTADDAAPWLASDIQRVSFHHDDGRDTAEIIRDFERVANGLLAWLPVRTIRASLTDPGQAAPQPQARRPAGPGENSGKCGVGLA